MGQSFINFGPYQTLKRIMTKSLPKSTQIMDSACRGYPESTPNFLHKESGREIEENQFLNVHPQYPLCLLLLLLLRRTLSVEKYFRKRTVHTPIQQ
jgi:hypothetical protein